MRPKISSNQEFYAALCALNEAHDHIMDGMRHDRTPEQKQRLMRSAYAYIQSAMNHFDAYSKEQGE